MKLRNKKTGKIAKPFGITCIGGRTFVQFDDGKGTFKFEARSLTELNAEWEDYEEPKEYWFIDIRYPKVEPKKDINLPNSMRKRLKQIGNYFETKEEAEKAVEKLKAWKRLKGKGFRFEGWDNTDHSIIHNFSLFVAIEDLDDINKDLDLLFGGEE